MSKCIILKERLDEAGFTDSTNNTNKRYITLKERLDEIYDEDETLKINEASQVCDIYRFTSFDSFIYIVKTDLIIKSSFEKEFDNVDLETLKSITGINFEEYEGFCSFSRNFNYGKSKGSRKYDTTVFRFAIDGNKMSNSYPFTPFDFHYINDNFNKVVNNVKTNGKYKIPRDEMETRALIERGVDG